MNKEDNFLEQLMSQDDITWQSMIFELVKTEQMDPWDVDLGKLSENFILMINEMKETNLKVGGKVILAATILLRLKSGKFIDTDLAQLEKLISGMNEEWAEDDFEEYDDFYNVENRSKPKNCHIYPRTPQPRKRKVSVYDLIGALEKIIEKNKIKVYKKLNNSNEQVELKLKNIDVNLLIRDVFESVSKKCRARSTKILKFSDITPSDRKEDLIATFLPLLHLTNQRVTDLYQEGAFTDFDVHLIREGLSFEDIEKINLEQ